MRGAMRSIQPPSYHRSGLARAEFGRFHAEAPRDGWIGSVLKERYQLMEKLGSGGEGSVYLASDRKERRLVAVKLIGKMGPPPEEAGGVLDLSDHFRFMRQLRACGMIDHPNIVKILDSGIVRGVPFVVMERLDGMDLQKAIRKEGGLDWAGSRDIVLRVCDGLKALHDRGIIHRDIKPSNIFLSRSPPEAKIIDFDLVKFEGAVAANDVADSDEIVGTPAYMAPEMLEGGASLDRRLDIYSLGATIYEMLAGVPPFTAGSYLELMKMHRDRLPKPISSVRPLSGVPSAVERLVAKALEKRPEDRFQTVDELKAAAEAIPPGPPESKGLLRSAIDSIRFLFGRFDPLKSLAFGPEDLPFDPFYRGR